MIDEANISYQGRRNGREKKQRCDEINREKGRNGCLKQRSAARL